ncbi:CPBP family intramembrane metalloprotease [Oceanicola sp. D3]|uniref:CPBP family intramembrane glutamic endopeptidase n=1 Tax=Oceanicola sp. D3 TaxID=2587163 RepID=UPI0011239547|nr:CPBP family intramembrane glutamic endopeptidase [Oceanicola sp. D3]QDC11176.1 CPBP family intramembrane metalloprotease [Oceanicola sp. D3]
MRHPEFAAMLVPARVYPQIWRLLLGVLLIVFIYISWTLIVLGGAVGVVAAEQGLWGVMPFFQELQAGRYPGSVALLLLTFGGMALGPVLAAAALHFRGPNTIFGPWGDWWRGFVTAFGVVALVFGGLMVASAAIWPPVANLEMGRWLIWMPLALPLLFLQIAAEEILFRGYLMQQLAARFAARWIWFTLPALAFGLLHWDPEAGRNLPLVLLSAFAFGLVAADLTERTGSLGAAMGFHFANNLLALFIVSIEGTITGLALYVTPWGLAEEGIVSLGLVVSIVLLFGNWWIIKGLLDR